MSPDTVAIAVAVITTLGGSWSYFDRRRVAKENIELQKQQVEAQAYSRARAHYDAIIDDLTKHVAWLKSELADARSELDTATEENTRLREQIAGLEKTIEALRSASVIVIESPKAGDK